MNLAGLPTRINALGWCIIALVLRVAAALVSSPTLRDDSVYYVAAARQLAQGMGYLLHGQPTAYWPVGYPLFLSVIFQLFGVSLIAAKLVQAVLSVCVVGLGYWVAKRCYGREEPARLTAAILALLPSQIALVAALLGEIPFTLLTLLGFAFLLGKQRWYQVVLAGVCFGLAALVRPSGLLLPLLGLGLLTSSRWTFRMRAALVLYAAMILTTLPWAIRNYKVLHAPVWISTNLGVNLWMGNHVGASGGYDFTPEMEQTALLIGNEVRFDTYARSKALEFIREQPAEATALMIRKLALLWAPDSDGAKAVFPRDRSFQSKALGILLKLTYMSLWVTFGIALAKRHKPSWLSIAILFYFTILHVLTVAMPRYHIPAIPWLAIGAASIVMQRDPCRQDNTTATQGKDPHSDRRSQSGGRLR
jgi:4-amino-4-deoxy-L-arabinose transferase-like glycosyltransferase